MSPSPLVLALLASGLPSIVCAQERPPVLPTRDVDIVYHAGGMEQRWRFHASDHKLRLDPPTKGVYMILDYPGHRMTTVSDTEQATLETATLPSAPLSPGTTRRGTDHVAGLACTEWEAEDTTGTPTLACFTADGVMLRARRGTTVLAEATRVSFAPLDGGLFVVPPGYQHHGYQHGHGP